MLNWYAVYTRPRSEKKLRSNLDKLGIENYLPLLRQRKKWSDRFAWVEEPLFASYVFVHIDFIQDSLRVLKQPQAVYFVSTEGAASVINSEDIDFLKVATQQFADTLVIREISDIEAGQAVTITQGPFVGKTGVVERVQGKARVVVVFPMLNKSVEVTVPLESISKAVGPL